MLTFIKGGVSLLIVLLIFLTGCSQPCTKEYQMLYDHLNQPVRYSGPVTESEYYIVFLVDAHHLDYSNCCSFVTTVAKHPRDMSKTGDVGHAWFLLKGVNNGLPICLEGGFSGERGIVQPQYFDGIMNYIDFGYSNPTWEQMCSPVYEPNPAKYLWETQCDGFFQWGSGRHTPTYAAKINISKEQFNAVAEFVKNFDYVHYSLVGNQCSSYITQIGQILGLDLEAVVYLPIDSSIAFGGEELMLWTDSRYSVLPISSPDILEKRLIELVRQGEAEPVLDWYLKAHPKSFNKRLYGLGNTLAKFPHRYSKFLFMKECMRHR